MKQKALGWHPRV